MTLPDFGSFLLWTNLGIFAVAAAVVWYFGTKLATYGDLISDRTGLGRAFVGLVLLSVATSLPEVATTATATLGGHPNLAANNLLGGVVMQTAILALADAAYRNGPLTVFTPRPVLLLQGNTLIVLLAIVLAAVSAGPLVVLGGVSLWSVVLVGVYLLAVRIQRLAEGNARWKPVDPPDVTEEGQSEEAQGQRRKYEDQSTRSIALRFAGASAVILVAGWLLTKVAEALAEQTGLGQSFVGATLVAVATSLPEVSATLAAVRLGALSMAVSNIFGSNAIDATLLSLADVLYRDGPIFGALDQSATFTTAVGIIVTAVYVIGLVERRDRAIGRLGLDSVTVVGVFLVSLVVLYTLR